MNEPSVAIVGFGAVGRGIQQLFPEAIPYDPPLGLGSKEAVNNCRYAMDRRPDAPACRTDPPTSRIVEEVVGWIECDHIIIRSTVPVGTTDRLRKETGKSIVFQPEYGPARRPITRSSICGRFRWVILGGERRDTVPVADLYKTRSTPTSLPPARARTAELTKYMENAFFATKVTFCNEFFDIAQAYGVDYNELRELWLVDPRISRDHTFVFPSLAVLGALPAQGPGRGESRQLRRKGMTPVLLQAVAEANRRFRAGSDQEPESGTGLRED